MQKKLKNLTPLSEEQNSDDDVHVVGAIQTQTWNLRLNGVHFILLHTICDNTPYSLTQFSDGDRLQMPIPV